MPRPKKPKDTDWFEAALQAFENINANSFTCTVADKRGEPEKRRYTVLSGIARNQAIFNLLEESQIIERVGRFIEVPDEIWAAAQAQVGRRIKYLANRTIYRIFDEQLDTAHRKLKWDKVDFKPTWDNLRNHLNLEAQNQSSPQFGFNELPPTDRSELGT